MADIFIYLVRDPTIEFQSDLAGKLEIDDRDNLRGLRVGRISCSVSIFFFRFKFKIHILNFPLPQFDKIYFKKTYDFKYLIF